MRIVLRYIKIHCNKKKIYMENFLIFPEVNLDLTPSHIQGVSKKPQDKEMERVSGIFFILISFQEKYLCSLKIEVSPVVLHIITLHSSNYWLRYLWSIFMLDNIKIIIHASFWIFQFSTVNCKLWLYISQSINRAVEIYYMQNNRADLNFRRK